jgi:glutamate-ammonia-ligase adenylyltransferase
MAHGRTDRTVRHRRTLDALCALAAGGHIAAADAEALEEGHRFFRSVEQAMKLMDEKAEAVLVPGGPVAERIARRLGLRERDGQGPSAVLTATWQRHASEVRAIFERTVAPVSTEPPWKR